MHCIPPMSHTLNLNPSLTIVLLIKPWVDMTWEISSSDNFFRMVVFPELSRPSTKRRN